MLLKQQNSFTLNHMCQYTSKSVDNFEKKIFQRFQIDVTETIYFPTHSMEKY